MCSSPVQINIATASIPVYKWPTCHTCSTGNVCSSTEMTIAMTGTSVYKWPPCQLCSTGQVCSFSVEMNAVMTKTSVYKWPPCQSCSTGQVCSFSMEMNAVTTKTSVYKWPPCQSCSTGQVCSFSIEMNAVIMKTSVYTHELPGIHAPQGICVLFHRNEYSHDEDLCLHTWTTWYSCPARYMCSFFIEMNAIMTKTSVYTLELPGIHASQGMCVLFP